MVRCKHATLLRLRQEEDSSVVIECDGEMNMKQGSVRRVSRAHYGGYWNRIRLQSNCEKLRTMTQVQSRYRYAQRTLSARRLHRDERRHWTPPLATKVPGPARAAAGLAPGVSNQPAPANSKKTNDISRLPLMRPYSLERNQSLFCISCTVLVTCICSCYMLRQGGTGTDEKAKSIGPRWRSPELTWVHKRAGVRMAVKSGRSNLSSRPRDDHCVFSARWSSGQPLGFRFGLGEGRGDAITSSAAALIFSLLHLGFFFALIFRFSELLL